MAISQRAAEVILAEMPGRAPHGAPAEGISRP
jgi:hypothetical protein